MRDGSFERLISGLRHEARLAAQPVRALLELGRVCLEHHRPEPALEAYREASERHPGSAILRFNFGWFAKQAGRAALAIDQYSRALTLGIDRPEEVHLNIANVWSELCADPVSARAALGRAIALNGAYLPAWLNLGNLLEQEGDRQGAREAFSRCLDIDPSHPTALARWAETVDFRSADPSTAALHERMVAVHATTGDPDLAFALGRAAEQRGDYALAWRRYTQGNDADRAAGLRYEPAAVDRAVAMTIRTCTPDWLARQSTAMAAEPVFICGSFRSGSTLLEQMLAAHPAFSPAGEREFLPRLVAREFPSYPEGLEELKRRDLEGWAKAYRDEWKGRAPAGARVTDKRPDNLLFVGLIKAMFPRARVLVTRRDWRDVAASLFTTRLGPAAAHATDLVAIRHRLAAEARLAAHWASLLGPDLQFVDYERLVEEPRTVLQAVLEGLAAPWDERCLEFHALRNPVRTASVWQVREPLHAGSIGRWRRFEPAFIAAFGEAVREGPDLGWHASSG